MENTQNSSKVMRNVYLAVLFEKIKKQGVWWTIKKASLRSLKELAWLSLLPFAILLHLLGFRRLLIRVEHIGHLAAEFDSFMKEQILELLPSKRRYYFVLAPKYTVSNSHLLGYWEQYVYILKNSIACGFLSLLSRHYFLRCDVSRYISSFFGAQEIYRINQRWGMRPPILKLSNEDLLWSKTAFENLGIRENQWFVCMHVREGGFLPHNELIQSHRNASISNMLSSIEEIVSRGGIVIRMGDPSMSPLPPTLGVIDYAHHPMKSARMDVVLCAKAKFFLGCTSGLSFVSMIFGIPVAQVNMIPVEALGVHCRDLSIPKLLWSENENRFFHFNEVLNSPMGGYYFTYQYKEAGIKVVENSAEDILSLTREMLERLDGCFTENQQDSALHDQYMSLFKANHYSYGAASRVGLGFLREHKDLIS